MSELSVNTTQLQRDADGFTGISTLAEGAGSYLRNSLAPLGEFWGTDPVGGTFATQFFPAIQGLLDTFAGIRDGMLATSTGITTSANLYKKSNDINTELAG